VDQGAGGAGRPGRRHAAAGDRQRAGPPVQGRRSPFSLYAGEYATFEADEVYNQADAAGFINLFGLPLRIGAQVEGRPKPLEEVA
jgi:hypothetical protein